MIELENINKSFLIQQTDSANRYLFRSVWEHIKGKHSRKQVLQNIGCTILPGERVAITGFNKSGKTTLAHIIAGIITPDSGSVFVEGKVVTVFGLGVGYSTLLSGRENLLLNATALGATFKWLKQNFEAIRLFAEIEDLDMPLKFYSNGMRGRLALAAAILIPCDILILDEVFVGLDEQFKAKSIAFLAERIKAKNITLIMTDHETENLQKLCVREICLDKGIIIKDLNLQKEQLL